MLFLSFTKSKVPNLNCPHISETAQKEFIATIATDDLLSYFTKNKNGFTAYESLNSKKTKSDNQYFLKITFESRQNTLTINQSTMSGRPLYYHINKEGEFFCSTHISLLKQARVQITENKEVLPEFFIYRYVMPPNTLYKNIYKILNGDSIQIKLINNKWRITSFDKIKINTLKNRNQKPKEIFKKTQALIDKSVKNPRFSQKNIAFLLSGGMDSSILCKLLQINYKVKKTYSGGYPFEDAEKNTEKEYALSAAKAFGTEHKYFEPSSEEYLKGLVEAIYYAEEPLHHLQSVVLYLMFKKGIEKDKNIIISGFGADGIFGCGLQNKIYRSNKLKWRIMSHQPLMFLLNSASKITSKGKEFIKFIKTKQERDVPYSNHKNIIWTNGKYGSEEWVTKQYNVSSKDIIKGRYNYFKSFENYPLYDMISIMNFSGSTIVSESILSKLAESNNKIIYYPFNNKELMDYAYSVDWNLKLKEPKYLLRKVAENINVPNFIITRKKSGFGLSIDSWAKKGGAFEPLTSLILKVFNESEIRKVQSADSKKAMIYWNMINYGIWKRLFIYNEPLSKLLNELDKSLKTKK